MSAFFMPCPRESAWTSELRGNLKTHSQMKVMKDLSMEACRHLQEEELENATITARTRTLVDMNVMQMERELKNVNLEKFAFIPKTSTTEFSRSTTAPVQTGLEEQGFSETRNYTQRPQDGARCSYFGNKDCVNQQRASASQYHNNMTDADKYSSWSQKPVNAIIDLDDDVWDDFDDENLLDASSSATAMEKSIPGSNISTYNKNQSKVSTFGGKPETVGNYTHQQLEYSNLETNLNINIQKQVDFPDSEILKYRPNAHKAVAATGGQYSGRTEVSALNAPLSYKAHYSNDFFVSTCHESENQDEEIQAFIGIFDGIF